MKVAVISDTHGKLCPKAMKYISACDEVWHAGDIGKIEVLDTLDSVLPTRVVYGNIDGQVLRRTCEEVLVFTIKGLKILMLHIAGYPKKYNVSTRSLIKQHQPDVVVCGHSHILKVIYDKEFNHLHINPGAIGFSGFHQVRTMITFEIQDSKPTNMKVIEFEK